MPRRSSVLLALIGLATLGSSGCYLTYATFGLVRVRPWERASEVAVTRQPDGVHQVRVTYEDGARRTLLWTTSAAEAARAAGVPWAITPDRQTWQAEPNGTVELVGEPVEVVVARASEGDASEAAPLSDGIRSVDGRWLELVLEGRVAGQLPIDRRSGRHSTPVRLLFAITLPFAAALDLVTAPLQAPIAVWAFLSWLGHPH